VNWGGFSGYFKDPDGYLWDFAARFTQVAANVHGLYQRFGFQPITQSEYYISIHNPTIY
jgi:hypothetical protein